MLFCLFYVKMHIFQWQSICILKLWILEILRNLADTVHEWNSAWLVWSIYHFPQIPQIHIRIFPVLWIQYKYKCKPNTNATADTSQIWKWLELQGSSKLLIHSQTSKDPPVRFGNRKVIHVTFYNGCTYLFMLVFTLKHVSKQVLPYRIASIASVIWLSIPFSFEWITYMSPEYINWGSLDVPVTQRDKMVRLPPCHYVNISGTCSADMGWLAVDLGSW